MKNSYVRFFAALFICLAVAGCSSMPGSITERTSSFDGSTELSMKPAFIYRSSDGFSGSDLQASLHWRSSMDTDQLILTMYANGIHRIPSENSLKIKINGDLYEFSSIDLFTDFASKYGPSSSWAIVPPSNSSLKRYSVETGFIRSMLSAKDVRVRLNLGTANYVEGIFSDTTLSAAKPAFEEFMRKRTKLME